MENQENIEGVRSPEQQEAFERLRGVYAERMRAEQVRDEVRGKLEREEFESETERAALESEFAEAYQRIADSNNEVGAIEAECIELGVVEAPSGDVADVVLARELHVMAREGAAESADPDAFTRAQLELVVHDRFVGEIHRSEGVDVPEFNDKDETLQYLKGLYGERASSEKRRDEIKSMVRRGELTHEGGQEDLRAEFAGTFERVYRANAQIGSVEQSAIDFGAVETPEGDVNTLVAEREMLVRDRDVAQDAEDWDKYTQIQLDLVAYDRVIREKQQA